MKISSPPPMLSIGPRIHRSVNSFNEHVEAMTLHLFGSLFLVEASLLHTTSKGAVATLLCKKQGVQRTQQLLLVTLGRGVGG